MSSNSSLNDIQFWLEKALDKEQLIDFSVKILGNSEKGDGYLGDIVFVNVQGKTSENKSKTYDLVLKCSKKSNAMRESMPVKETFENEIYLYSHVFPVFRQFQVEKNVKNVFDSVTKYYGKFVNDNMEMFVLQNLRVLGYKLYNRKIPLTLDHLKLTVGEYGKWHAISAAMQDQQPEVFRKLVSGLKDVWTKFGKSMDLHKFYGTHIEEAYDLIKQDGSDYSEILYKLKSQVPHIVELIHDQSHFSVITHGDCWTNNFMFKYDDVLKDKPVKIAMLDWQISSLANPVTDLSYFLYACISPEDLENFEDILKEYHASFSNHLSLLGSDPEKIYPYSKLLEDWKIFAKFGIMLAMFVIKVALTDSDEVQDVAAIAESGRDINSIFSHDIKNKTQWKERVVGIVKHIIEWDLI